MSLLRRGKIQSILNHEGLNKRWSFFYPCYKVNNSFGIVCQGTSWFVSFTPNMLHLGLSEVLQLKVNASYAIFDSNRYRGHVCESS